MSGWIKLSRAMSDNWLWQEKPFSKGQAWVDLLMFANHRPAKILIKGQMLGMDRGDQARSEVTLAETWGWSRGKVRRFLKTLENDSMIVQQTSNATSIITICNYKEYQDGGTPDDTADGTAGSTAPGTPPEHQTVHSEEVKECKNEKKKGINPAPGKPDPAADSVFAYWCQVMKKGTNTKFTADRKRRVRDRLKDGYTVEQICMAIDGCANSPHHMGQNDRNTVFDDLELICRTGSKLENFASNIGTQQKMQYSQTTAQNLKNTEGWVPPEMRNGNQ